MTETKFPDEAFRWWGALNNKERPDTATLADLRRCRTPVEVGFVPAFHDLRVRTGKNSRREMLATARVAGVLAHVREHDGSRRVAAQLAAKSGNAGPVYARARFRKLMDTADPDGERFMDTMVRAVRQLNGVVNVHDLADSVYWWNDHTRLQWARHYYENAPPEGGK